MQTDGRMDGRTDGWMDGWVVTFRIFADADRRLYGEPTNPSSTREEAVRSLVPYAESLLAEGQRLHRLTRHMTGALSSSSLPPIELPLRLLAYAPHTDTDADSHITCSVTIWPCSTEIHCGNESVSVLLRAHEGAAEWTVRLLVFNFITRICCDYLLRSSFFTFQTKADFTEREASGSNAITDRERNVCVLFWHVISNRRWRRMLSEEAQEEGARAEVLLEALECIAQGRRRQQQEESERN